jgi:hypothetical protein
LGAYDQDVHVGAWDAVCKQKQQYAPASLEQFALNSTHGVSSGQHIQEVVLSGPVRSVSFTLDLEMGVFVTGMRQTLSPICDRQKLREIFEQEKMFNFEPCR